MKRPTQPRGAHIVALICVAIGATACGDALPEPDIPATAEQRAAAQAAWGEVYRVLSHPRCMNCHPDGDAPLQTDLSTPHTFGVNRAAIADGLECSNCHQDVNSDALGVTGGPPGAPNWGFPPADTPMIFQGRTPVELCWQFHDTQATGGRDLAALLEHVSHESLVTWAWNPGGDRSTPPISQSAFVDAFATWVEGDGECPDEDDGAQTGELGALDDLSD